MTKIIENKTINDIRSLIKEDKNIFIQKVKNKLKGAHKLSDSEANDVIDKNGDDLENAYKNKEKENKTSTRLSLKKK